jgi:hypothetical protein
MTASLNITSTPLCGVFSVTNGAVTIGSYDTLPFPVEVLIMWSMALLCFWITSWSINAKRDLTHAEGIPLLMAMVVVCVLAVMLTYGARFDPEFFESMECWAV